MSEVELRAQVRRRLEKRYEKRQEVLLHAAIYGFVNVILWIGAIIFPWNATLGEYDLAEFASYIWIIPLLVTLGWGIGLFAHFMDYYFKHGPGLDRREQYIQIEIERELARRNWHKLKNEERNLHLGDDGELLENTLKEDNQEQRRY